MSVGRMINVATCGL